MAATAQDAYLEERILSADPVELVRILYDAAVDAVQAARRHLAAGHIATRSTAISKAVEILAELTASLHPERAPQVSQRLAELYDYMQRRLLAANFEQADAPLAEVLQLLQTLAEAWKAVPLSSGARDPVVARLAAPGRWNPAAGGAEPEPAAHGWSF